MGRVYSVPTQDFLQKTLSAQLLAGTTAAATFNDVTGIPNLPGVFIVDRVDTNGVETPAKREVIAFSGTSGSTVTTLTRGLAGSTDQVHAIGAIVEFSPDIIWAQSVYDGLSQVVAPATGLVDATKIVDLTTVQTVGNKNLSIPTITVGSDATGDLYYRAAGATLARLPLGSAGQILTANASLPAWSAAVASNTDGWTTASDTWVFATAATFTIAGVDRTAIYTKGTRLKFTQTTVKYATVISSAFGTDTTVTIATNTDYTIANAAITLPFYSYEASPAGYPGWFNFAAGTSWNSTPPSGTTATVAQYSVVGQQCFYRYYQNNTVAGTTNTSVNINQPIPSSISAAIFHDAGGGYVSSAEYSSAPNQTPNTFYATLSSNTVINGIFPSLSAKALWMQGFYAI